MTTEQKIIRAKVGLLPRRVESRAVLTAIEWRGICG